MPENQHGSAWDSGEHVDSRVANRRGMNVVSGTAEGGVPEPQRIQFAGRGSEYFGIWIVNVLLSVVTFGIWTAWAKVRRVQYFNGRTLVLGDPLEYHATGWMIFKGRFLAFLVLIAFSILSNVLGTVHPAAPAIPTLTLFALYPWVINRSLRFSARMTSWRNVRFNWQGTYWGVTKIYFVWPLLGLLTLGACFPLAARALRHYVANNYLFGTTRFSARTPIGPYYVAFGWSLLFFISVAVSAAGLLLLFSVASGAYSSMDETGLMIGIAQGAGVLLGILSVILLMLSGLVFTALTRNIIVSALRLGGAATFESDLKPLRFVWIAFSNLIISVATFFLLLPWAQVRAFRYQAEHVTVAPKVPVSTFVDRETQQIAAFGEEFAELEGLDVTI